MRNKKCHKWVIGTTIGVYIFSTVSWTTLAERSFDSPENAIDYFINEIKTGDVEGALEAFPVERTVDNFDFSGLISRLGGWNSHLRLKYPSNSEMFRIMNRNSFTSEVLSEIDDFMAGFVIDPIFMEELVIPTENVDVIGLMEQADADKLAGLEKVRMDYFWPDTQNSEEYRINAIKRAQFYGADNEYGYLILYKIDDELFYGGATFLEYEGEYYLWDLTCSLAGVYSNQVVAVTESEYFQMLDE